MHRVSLLFGPTYVFLGEIMTRDGGFERVLLNANGETSVGAYLHEWQMRGIPIVREVMQRGNEHIFFQERVPIRSHEFAAALVSWGMTHGMIAIDLSDEMVRLWEQMLQLPVEEAERFSMIVVMRAAPQAHFVELREAIDAAVTAVSARDSSAGKKLVALRKTMAGTLVKKLQHA